MVIISGAVLSSVSLLIFTHFPEQLTAKDVRRECDRVALRLYGALQELEHIFPRATPAAESVATATVWKLISPSGRQLVSDSGLPRGLENAAARPRHFAPNDTSLTRAGPFWSAPLVMAHQAPRAKAQLFSPGRERQRPPDWIRPTEEDLIATEPEAPGRVGIAPRTTPRPDDAQTGRSSPIQYGGREAGMNLSQDAGAQDEPGRSLALTLGIFGMLLSGLTAWVSSRNRRKEQHVISTLRKDSKTSFLTHYALAKDLEAPSLKVSLDRHEAGLLVTIDFRHLERHGGFTNEPESIEVLTKSCLAIDNGWPMHPDFHFYHVSRNKIALIVRESQTIPIHDTAACEAFLARLLGIVSGSIQISSDAVLAWDDVIITGQRFQLDAPPNSLLTMQVFGEMLAAEDRRSFRLVKSGDDLLVKEKSAIRSQLNSLKASDLELLFQPIVQICNPGHFGLELLIRFLPPALNKLGTEKVIQMAHDLGIAHRIDALVISRLTGVQQALRESELLRHRIEYISVNISADSVATEQRLNHLINLFKEHAIDSSTFYIEITEMAATDILVGSEDLTTASERLIKELGFRIFIDDFGSGLSNYRRISEAWYDAIKLDIDLIKGIDRSFRLQRYVGSFIDTVHALGKTVVCEGVETLSELTAVVRLGADALQGFLISPPIAMMDVEAFLRSSEWADRDYLQQALDKFHATAQLRDPGNGEEIRSSETKVSLERYILDNWSRLRSFEEFVLLFVNELRSWGLEIHRFSLAFLPDQDDIDCSQYVWVNSRPGRVATLRMERDFLEQAEHLCSPLHFIATRSKIFRQKLSSGRDNAFPFLHTLKAAGCSDYLGIRLDSRGVSIPVLTIALQNGSEFSDEEVQRIEAMSSLLSLLFYAFESERSKRMAMLDPLTQLGNRRSFDSFLKGNISGSRLAQASLSLALIDIDQFKVVNDMLGHAYGDTCLKQIADTLKACLRSKSDFVARLGGEEFAIILPKTDAESSLNLCERLRQSILKKEIYHPGLEAGNTLTVSVGVAVWNPLASADCDADRIMQLADDCLYEAKRNGRNRVVCRSLLNQVRLSSRTTPDHPPPTP